MNERIAYICGTLVALALIALWYRGCHEREAAKEQCIEATHDVCQCSNAYSLSTSNQPCPIITPEHR